MDNRTKFWILLFCALLIILCAAFLLLNYMGVQGSTAKIYLDGELIEEIDLNAVAIAYEFEVSGKWGTNTVYVENGQISVTHADCPDQVCVKTGAVSTAGIPIVCMPHRLVIRLEEAEE